MQAAGIAEAGEMGNFLTMEEVGGCLFRFV